MPSIMSRKTVFLLCLIATVVCLSLIPTAHAFGAGNIPSFAFLEGKAFRHGDLEDVLLELHKKSGGLFGMGSKFSGFDAKVVYFGNWLRD